MHKRNKQAENFYDNEATLQSEQVPGMLREYASEQKSQDVQLSETAEAVGSATEEAVRAEDTASEQVRRMPADMRPYRSSGEHNIGRLDFRTSEAADTTRKVPTVAVNNSPNDYASNSEDDHAGNSASNYHGNAASNVVNRLANNSEDDENTLASAHHTASFSVTATSPKNFRRLSSIDKAEIEKAEAEKPSKFRRLWQSFRARQNSALHKAATEAKLLSSIEKVEAVPLNDKISANLPDLQASRLLAAKVERLNNPDNVAENSDASYVNAENTHTATAVPNVRAAKLEFAASGSSHSYGDTVKFNLPTSDSESKHLQARTDGLPADEPPHMRSVTLNLSFKTASTADTAKYGITGATLVADATGGTGKTRVAKTNSDAVLAEKATANAVHSSTPEQVHAATVHDTGDNDTDSAHISPDNLFVTPQIVLYKGLSDAGNRHLSSLQAQQAAILPDNLKAEMLRKLGEREFKTSIDGATVTLKDSEITPSAHNDGNAQSQATDKEPDRRLDLAYLKRETEETWKYGKEITEELLTKTKEVLPGNKILSPLKKSVTSFKDNCRRTVADIKSGIKTRKNNFFAALHNSKLKTDAHNAALPQDNIIAKIIGRRLDLKSSLQFLAGAALSLCVIFGLIYIIKYNFAANSEFKNDLSNNIQGLHQAGKLEHQLVTLEQLTLDLNYPLFNESYLDYLIKSEVDALIQPYIKQAENDVRSRQLRKKPLLNIDYDSYLLNNRLLSLVFTVNYYAQPDKERNLSALEYKSLYYDLTYHLPLSSEDLLGKDNKIKQDISNNFNEIFAYERQSDLGLEPDSPALENLLFTKDELVLIVDPKHSNADLKNPALDTSKALIAQGGSRYLYANYIALPYKEASKYFNANADLPVMLQYDVWLRYLEDENPHKIFPFGDKGLDSGAKYKYLALTFNNLPDASQVDALLNLLAEQHMQATFFINGKDAEDPAKAAIIAKIAAQKHEIANLGYSGDGLQGYEDQVAFVEQEVEKSKTLLETASGGSVSLYRAPLKADFNNYLRLVNYPLIRWNNFSDDKNNATERIVKYLTSNPEAGDIILLHADNAQAVEALRQAAAQLEAAHCRYVKVSDLALIYGNKLRAKQVVYEELSPLKAASSD